VSAEKQAGQVLPLVFDVEEVERRGCLTFSRVCTNLGKAKVQKGSTKGREGYYCARGFPPDCSKYNCPTYLPIVKHSEWKLKPVELTSKKT